jgi:hypothetical protein
MIIFIFKINANNIYHTEVIREFSCVNNENTDRS